MTIKDMTTLLQVLRCYPDDGFIEIRDHLIFYFFKERGHDSKQLRQCRDYLRGKRAALPDFLLPPKVRKP